MFKIEKQVLSMNAMQENGTSLFQAEKGLTLSIVIPVYNERQMLPLLFPQLATILEPLQISYELVMVDDGSRDGSGHFLAERATWDEHLKLVRLSRNFGKEAALTAGLAYAEGQAIIIMDADLQDPPVLIPQMLQAWREGADVVSMKRRSRAGESWFKKFSAHGFYRLLNRISEVEIPEDTGDFRLLSRKAVNAMSQLGERNRYMKGLFAWIGMPTKVIDYDRMPRAAGTSKWDYPGLMKLAFEGITSFSVAPLRLTMVAGILTALAGILFALWIVAKTMVLGEPVQGYPSLISMITFLGGVQLISIGLLGEYVGKTYFEAKQRPVYLIRDVLRKNQGQAWETVVDNANAMNQSAVNRQEEAVREWMVVKGK
jgi:glycosyltransferase involved in cell wall biosynthesis